MNVKTEKLTKILSNIPDHLIQIVYLILLELKQKQN